MMNDQPSDFPPNRPIRDLDDLVDTFWRFCRGEISTAQFESLVESDPRVRALLDDRLYEALYGCDYGDAMMMAEVRSDLWRWINRQDPSFALRTYGYMTVPLKAVRYDSATCTACGGRFPLPTVGAFSLGRFILSGLDGERHLYLESLANPAFESIQRIVLEAVSDRLTGEECMELVLEVAARCADPLAGVSFTARDVCPVCHTEQSSYLTDVTLFEGMIPVASFRSFNLIADAERRLGIGRIIERMLE